MKPIALVLALVVAGLLLKAALSVHWLLVLPASSASVVIVVIAWVCSGK